ncbi:MAG: hypothetical protein U0996_14400 [Planctomycetaceae bacterium]
MAIKKRKLQKKWFSAPAEVQQLESRTLPTGIVTASVSAAFDVSLLGDNGNNEVHVDIDGGLLKLTGQNGTSIKVGNVVTPAGTAVTLPNALFRDLNVSLGNGNDSFTTNIDEAIVFRTVNVNMGSGNDTLALDTSAAVTLTGSLLVRGEKGNDFVRVSASAGLTIAGSLGINTGAGNDQVALVDTFKFNAVVGPTTAATITQLDAVIDDTLFAGNQNITVTGDINVFTEAGADSVALLGVEAGRDILVNMGNSDGEATLASNVRAGRNLGFANGDYHSLNNLFAGQYFGIRSGAGNDVVLLDNLSAGKNIDIYLGGGNDSISLGAGVAATGNIRVEGEAGKDQIKVAAGVTGLFKKFEGNNINEAAQLTNIVNRLILEGLLPVF